MSHRDAIARKCFHDEVWHEEWKRASGNGFIGGGLSIFLVAFAFHLLVIPRDPAYGLLASFVMLGPALASYWHSEEDMYNLTAAITAHFKSWREVPRRMQAFHSRDPDFILRVCTFGVEEYREQITAECERMLGEGSEWARRRETVRGASEGASGTVDYWTDRLREEPGSQEARERLAAATELRKRLAQELRSLDEYATAVEGACDGCRDQVDGIERRIRDVEQIRQIGEASVAAGNDQALADASVKEIAAKLFDQAESVGVAIANISRLELSAAAEAAGDSVEQPAGEAAEESEENVKVTVGPGLAAENQPSPATVEPVGPEQPLERVSGVAEIPKVTPIRPRPVRDSTPSTARAMPTRLSDAEEEGQMKKLVISLRRMADVQERKAHDLRFRDEGNSEAYDREELAEKMTELADEIEMFFAVKKRMQEWRAQNS